MSNFTKLKLCHTFGISQSAHLWMTGIFTFLLLFIPGSKAEAQNYQNFYSRTLIDAKINDFAGNTKPMGFGSYNSQTGKITQPVWYEAMDKKSTRNLEVDYVAGLVAKACIEAADYYKDFTWSKPWFKLVENYATKVTVPTTGASLDDLNAAKMYFALAELTKKGAKYENSTTYNRAITELKNALTGLKAVNNNYSIRSGSTVNYYSGGKKTFNLVDADGNELSPATSGMNAIGGWYHKATYPNEMWCDSEYMGPALLAQLVAYATENTSAGIGTITGTTEGDWKLIAKQFDITWNYLWNSTDKLLYHGFSATPTAVGAHTYTWATGKNGTNKDYWGRAIGWYFLALVDVLENMPDNISDDSYTSTQENLKSKDANIKNRLKSYLTDLAEGIWAQRKTDTNLWTNVINEAVGTVHDSYSTTDIQSNTKNYLEASASAIYIATYLKAMRLGLLPSGTYKSGIGTAYQNYISNFITTDNTIINTCASAGLGGGSVKISSAETDYKEGGKKYRNGTADYYTRGYDVTKITKYQEGKPLGAFILASTEYERYMKADYTPSFTDANSENPTAQTITKGQSVTLHAAAMAKPVATYQWYSYPASASQSSKTMRAAATGTAIEGATSSDLTVSPEANTYYYCVADNGIGTAAQTDAVLVTVNEESSGGGSIITKIFSLHVTSTATVSVESKKSIDAKDYATITGGSATLYNGHADPRNLVTGGQFNLNGSGGSYIKIVLNDALQAGDVIEITPSESSFKLLNSSKNEKSIGSTYTVTAGDNFVGEEVIYLYRGSNSNSLINDITISRPNPGADSRATFTYDGSQLSFTETAAGTYTTTIEIGASKRGKPITITTAVQDGATIKEGETPVTSSITITAPSTGQTTTKKYTVTSSDGTSKTTYIINVTVVKEKLVLVYSDKNGNTEWTWNKTASSTKPTFNSPTVKAYYPKSDGTADTNKGVTDGLSYTYVSDMGSVATVNSSGTITIGDNTTGGAKIYATLVSDNYYADPVAFDITIIDGYSYKVSANETAPGLNESLYITTKEDKTGETGTKLVKMTFGGWKWNSGAYSITRLNKDGTTTTKNYTDSWGNAGSKANDIASIDGHYYWFSGGQDAVDESRAESEEKIYGSYRYGWFKWPTTTTDSDGATYKKTNPFTLPVRGAFMTFEPTQNGVLTVYILQNGAWNTNDNGGTKLGITYNKGDIIPGEFRPHSFFVTNQRGVLVEDFAPLTHSVETKQKATTQYKCILKGSEGYDATDPYNIANWTEFKDYMTSNEQAAVAASWTGGAGGAQKIVKLDNGSYLAIQKGIVKYSFFVTANETYYLFSNFSKMGFSGANFIPDKDKAPTNDDAHKLVLKDDEKYPTIAKVSDSSDEDENKYAYKFDGTIKGYVPKFTIPLFYSIQLDRTFKPNKWTTLTLPFNLTQTEVEQIFGVGTRIVMLKDGTIKDEGARLTFIYHEIQNILPGYPYLIKPTLKDSNKDSYVTITSSTDGSPLRTISSDGYLTSFTVYTKAINPNIKQIHGNQDCNHYWHKGTPGYSYPGNPVYFGENVPSTPYSIKYPANDIFVSEGNGNLYVSGGTSYGKGYRAWLQKKETGNPTTVKSISVVMSSFSDDDDTATSIDVAEMAPDLIEALGIQTGVYNLSGQRVANDTRNIKAGIYIVNGKKTVVR